MIGYDWLISDWSIFRYVLIHGCRLQDSLSKRDLCVLLTACICHDLDHPGFNNTYQINARTELAVRCVIKTFIKQLIN